MKNSYKKTTATIILNSLLICGAVSSQGLDGGRISLNLPTAVVGPVVGEGDFITHENWPKKMFFWAIRPVD